MSAEPAGRRLRYAHWRAAIAVLEAIWHHRQLADATLQTWFREHREMGGRDRAQLNTLIYGVLRDAMRLRELAGADDRPETLLALHALDRGLVDAAHLETLGCIDAVALSERLRTAPAVSDAAGANVPPQWWARWQQHYGDAEGRALAAALNAEASVDLRVNLLKTDRETALAALQAEGITAAPTPWSPWGLRLPQRGPLAATRAYRDGLVEPQDEGSQLLAALVGARRGERVADFCAGAGGKTLALGASMQNRGELWALDISASRLARLPERARRAGLDIVRTRTLPDATWLREQAGTFDAVLVDAPCSGSGTWRRQPDLRLRVPDLGALAVQQQQILGAAAGLVRPGGRLIYATCSVLPDENQAVVAAWLGGAPAFAMEPAAAALEQGGVATGGLALRGDELVLLPHRHRTDGFFAARFVRRR